MEPVKDTELYKYYLIVPEIQMMELVVGNPYKQHSVPKLDLRKKCLKGMAHIFRVTYVTILKCHVSKS